MINQSTSHDSASDESPLTGWGQRKLAILVSGSLVAAFILVAISISMYNGSGTAQLDLSRPEYQSVIDQVEPTQSLQQYPSIGEMTVESFNDFDDRYDEQLKTITTLDAFGGNAMSDTALGLPVID